MVDSVSVLPTQQLAVDAGCVTLDTNLFVVAIEGLILTSVCLDVTPVLPSLPFLWCDTGDVVSQFICLAFFS